MKLLEEIDIEPGIRPANGDRRPLDMETVQRMVETLKAARDKHGREDAYKQSGLPPVLLNGDREIVNGRHRDEACGLADVPVRAKVFQFDDHIQVQEQIILENLGRTQLTPEQEREDLAALVKLQELRNDAAGLHAHAVEKPPRGGRPTSAKREAIREVAEKTGRSERTVERAVKASEEPRPVVERPPAAPSLDKRLASLVNLVKECQQAVLHEACSEEVKPWRDARRFLDSAATKAFEALEHVEKALWHLRDAKKLLARTDDHAGARGRQMRAEGKIGDGPKTGLGGKKLRIEVVSPELPPPLSPEEEAAVFEAADAAGVGPGEKGRW